MAGYFISTTQQACEKAIKIYQKKGITEYKILKANQYYCVYFYKQNSQDSTFFNDIYIYNDSFFFGTGYYIYKNKLGSEALKLIFQDLQHSKFDFNIFKEINGHYNFVLFYNQQLYIITDKTGNYHSYYSIDKDKHIYISTSFLSICENVTQLTPSLQEILEYICLSSWQGYQTIFKEINKLSFGKIYTIINQNISIAYSYYSLNLNGKHESFETVLKHIKNYFSFLPHYDDNICSDLTGGADSRLLLASIHSQTQKLTCYCNEYSNDFELASNIAFGENIKLHKLNTTEKQESKAFIDTFIKVFYLFDMTRPMFWGAYYGEYEAFNFPSNRINIIRMSGHAAELSRKYDWIYDNISFIDFITGQYQLISNIQLKKLFIKNIIKKIEKEVTIENKNCMTYKDINKIYLLLRCRTWAGARITTSNQKCFHMFPFEDINLNHIFFNQDESVIKNNFLLKKLLHYLYPNLNQYPSCYNYSFEYNEDENTLHHNKKETIRPQKTSYFQWKKIRHNIKHFLLGSYKHNRKLKKLLRINPDMSPFIINKEITNELFGKKDYIIKSIIKDLNITIQNDLIKDGIFSLEFILRTYENKIKI